MRTSRPLRLVAMTLMGLALLASLPAVDARADELGDRIREVFDDFRRYVVTVSFSRLAQAGELGQQDMGGSVVGVLVDDEGLVMVCGQEFVAGDPLINIVDKQRQF